MYDQILSRRLALFDKDCDEGGGDGGVRISGLVAPGFWPTFTSKHLFVTYGGVSELDDG